VIPYLHIPPLRLFGFEAPFFTVFALLAAVAGIVVSLWRAKELGVSRPMVVWSLVWLAAGITVGAHLVSVLLYFPHWIARDPLVMLKLWEGMSSFGGFLGGFVAGMLYVKRWEIPAGPLADVHIFGALACLTVGRMGCSIAHDHPGRETDFFLAVQGWPSSGAVLDSTRELGFYTEGLTRHDLGLYELLFLLVLSALVFALRRFEPVERFHVILVLGLYAPVRFAFDFLRTADPHYLGLTPGQWFSIVMFSGAMALLVRGLMRRPAQVEERSVPDEAREDYSAKS
jgi:phosphatidylglycerol---prolipoprotein diacylglyceryl transferase